MSVAIFAQTEKQSLQNMIETVMAGQSEVNVKLVCL